MIRRTILALLLIGLAGGIGYWLAPSLDSVDRIQPQQQTLTARSVAHTDKIDRDRTISTAEQTNDLIRRELNRQISIPQIDQFSLTGVTIEEIVNQARVPVLIYENQDAPVVVYAYNYALLDDHPGDLYLSKDQLEQLEREGRFATERYGDRHVVLWRHRDDIFAAVTGGSPDSLIQRIRSRG